MTTSSLWCEGTEGVQDEGATVLAEALEFNETLRELNLFQNNLGEIGASRLAQALFINTSLVAQSGLE